MMAEKGSGMKLTTVEQPVWDAFVVALLGRPNPTTVGGVVDGADSLIVLRREHEGKQEEPVNAQIVQLVERMESACEVAHDYAGCEGDHHRMWVIDQMLRALLRSDYEKWIAEYLDGGKYEWDVGIAP